MTSAIRVSRVGYWLRAALVAATYFGAAKAGLALAFEPKQVTAVWPPTGLALAAVLIWGARMWPGIAVGAFLANITTSEPLGTALGITVGNTAEALVGGYLLSRVPGFRPSFERTRDVIALAALAAVASTVVSATVGVASLLAGGLVRFGATPSAWRVWWLGDMDGDLLVAPALLIGALLLADRRRARGALEAVAVGLAMAGFAVLVFSTRAQLAYLLFPVIFAASLRFRQAGATASSLAVSAVAVWATTHHRGPFAGASPDSDLLRAQTFAAVVALTALLTAAMHTERGRAQESLELSEAGKRQLDELLGSLPDTIVTLYDRDLRCLLVRGAGVASQGLDRVDFEGQLLSEYLAPGQLEQLEPLLRGALEGSRVSIDEYTTASGDHTYQVVIAPYRHDDGTIAGVFTVWLDITERLASERQIRLLATIVQQSGDAIIALTPDGIIREWNDGARRLYGYSATEALGQPVSLVLPDDRPDEERWLLDRAIARQPSHLETTGVGKHGITVDVSLAVSPITDAADEVIGASVIARDITETNRLYRQLQFMADHDPLTGLLNRRKFEQELDRHVARVNRYGAEGALVVLDLDNFKQVNDTFGHTAGDEQLLAIADVLRERLRDSDVLARLGGDEFAVLLPKADESQATQVAGMLLPAVGAAPLERGRRKTTASAGVAMFAPQRGQELSAERILTEADLAMYDAKEAGGDQYVLYASSPGHVSRTKARLTWANRIEHALDHDRFTLVAQPILDLRTENIVQHELLVRMLDDDGDLIPPAAFLDVAERFGLIGRLDQWVVSQAIALIDQRPDLLLEVNISGASLGDRRLLAAIEERLRISRIEPARLIFEVTETAAVANIIQAQTFAKRLRDLGCHLALDDFGAGFGSFYYLKHLPFDYIKIDGEFVQHTLGGHIDQLVIEAVVHIAQGLGKETIAEYVTNEQAQQMVTRLGVDYAQGYYVGEPLLVEELFGVERPGSRSA